jgi:hypothetical protein
MTPGDSKRNKKTVKSITDGRAYRRIRVERTILKTIAAMQPKTAPRDCIRKTRKKQKQAAAKKPTIAIGRRL